MVRMVATVPDAPPRGLTAAEVAEHMRRGLVNREPAPVDRTYLRIVLEHALPPINVALYTISVVLVLMGLGVDALVTAGPVLAYVAVGIWQETRAKRQLDRIALLHRPRATVLRDGTEVELRAGDLVLGDVVVLRRGDQVIVDGRILAGDVELDEALLSGESDPVRRAAGARVVSGTVCVSGRALVEADRVGADSTSARLLRTAQTMRVERTPVQRALQRVILSVTGIVALAAVLVGARILGAGDATWADVAQAAAVLVALGPQGLLVVVTITYTLGAVTLARQGAIVQRFGAIEAMSHVDTLCVDKTGTLTTGRIRMVEAAVVGTGDPIAEVAASMDPPNATVLAIRAAQPADPRPTRWQVPFSSARRWSALRFADGSGRTHVLGAPDALIDALDAGADLVATRARALAASGHRVLLHAVAPATTQRPEAIPAGLTPVTIVACAEELRPDARAILDAMGGAGVELKMISGDDPHTLASVAGAAGIALATPAVAGPALGDDAAATRSLLEGTLFGRVDPETKARCVQLLRAAGRFVAMLGDGVNDLLALKRAQLGLAMGSGSPATRAVADLVLVEDDFALLPAVLRAGQRIVSAMLVTLELLLARTSSMLLIVVAAAVLGLPFPFTPRNNSVLALLTVGIPTVALALMVAPTRPPDGILRSALRFAVPSGIGIGLPALAGYALVLGAGGDVVVARTSLVVLTVLFGLGLLTLVARRWARPAMERRHRWRLWALAASMAAIFAIVLSVPPVRAFFELSTLDAGSLAALLAVGAAWTAAAHGLTGALGGAVIGRAERWIEDRWRRRLPAQRAR